MIAIAWVFYRPLLAIGLLLVAAGGVFLLMKIRKPKLATNAGDAMNPNRAFHPAQNRHGGGGDDVMTEDDIVG